MKFVLREVVPKSPPSGIHCGYVNNPSEFVSVKSLFVYNSGFGAILTYLSTLY